MSRIVVVEDDEIIREELESFLRKYGYETESTSDFANILEFIDSSGADLLLLDINLPVYDGYYICREIRKRSDMPIIVVTSRDSEVDELISMNLGADDFVTKPYNTQILLARIYSVLKRAGKSSKDQETMVYGGLKLNMSSARIQYGESEIELTRNEVKILSYLMKHKGSIVSRDALMEHLWKSEYFADDSTLNVNVARLRKKLKDIGMEDPIQTKRGLGYIMP